MAAKELWDRPHTEIGDYRTPMEAVLAGLVVTRTEKIINQLVADHRNKTLTSQEALTAAGVLSELRALMSDFKALTQRNAQLGTV